MFGACRVQMSERKAKTTLWRGDFEGKATIVLKKV